ncbi:hypothetical protein BT96DRAFT_987444 [Gymnopus androsaceus JB14]|uniref:Uncharacterized protein n=1 Tax=Gymnopus androsaceus JB14 TaxID=1447944 RepID=A0A6A4IBY6_9AGAR|nr:hypothetical protein BT96DRAFT_987444 [Gymnopus androsaceus JB14]
MTVCKITFYLFYEQSDPKWRCNSTIVGAINAPATGNLPTQMLWGSSITAARSSSNYPATAAAASQSGPSDGSPTSAIVGGAVGRGDRIVALVAVF